MATPQDKDKDKDKDKDNWSSTTYNTNANFVYSQQYTSPVVDLLALQTGEHILDLGCGSGDLTLSSLLPTVLPSGSIVGLDSSADLLSNARANTTSTTSGSEEDKQQISWVEWDGHELDVWPGARQGGYDAVFSNAALHWMNKDPGRVVKGVHKVLKRGGRFVGEMGGALNMVGVRSMLHTVLAEHGVKNLSEIDPWFFPTPEVYTALLNGAGFKVEYCELIPRPTPLATGLRGWLETFAFSFLDALPLQTPSKRESVIDEVCRRLEVDMKHDLGGGREEWMVMYVRLRFRAVKE